MAIALMLVLASAPAAQAAKRKPKRGPINAKVIVDLSRAASALITPAGGGRVAVNAANGTKVTVTFPAGAVLEDTLVTAAPVTRLASRSTRVGLLAGVQLQPEGLQLLKPAAVRFARRGKARKGKRLVFVGSAGTGKDVHRLPPPVRARGRGKKRRLVPTGAPVVSIGHFSTVEGFDWSTATIAEIDAINRPALGIHALSQELSRLLANHATVTELVEAMDRARERFIRPLLSVASSKLTNNCSEASVRGARTALQTALSFERQMQVVGGESRVAVDALGPLLRQVATCLTSLCPKLGDPRVGAYFLSLARQFALMGIAVNPAFFSALYENLVRCGAFEVHIDSRLDHVFEDSNFSLRVDGRAKYVPSLASGPPPRPRAPLTYVSTSGASVTPCETTEILKTTNGEFELTDVTLSSYDPDRPTQDPVLSVKITVTVQPIETYHTRSTPTVENCGTDMPPDNDAPLWFFGFQAEHRDFTFPGTDFVRDAAPKFALAVYSPNTILLNNGSVSENTLIEIIHTPQEPVPLPDPMAE